MSDLLGDKTFTLIMKEHAEQVLDYLLSTEMNFSILTNIKFVGFEPELPKQITDTFGQITMFTLAGYSLESVEMDEDHIYFEAGFGNENIGSLVSVPIFSIVQIVVDEKPIFINLSNYDLTQDDKKDHIGVQKSMEALLSNPENQKLLNKKGD